MRQFVFDDFGRGHIRSSWNAGRMLLRGKLTDKQIEKYQQAGWYSAEFRQARKDAQARAKAKRSGTKRDGNWLIGGDGSKTYSPL